MCGIIGYIGKRNVKDILLSCLETLEYRGYDSAGIAIARPDGSGIETVKCAGRVKKLREKSIGITDEGMCGMGHTRWATHGGVNDTNAHPHTFGRVTLIHNGIIENFQSLMKKYHLEDSLTSETDSEVVAGVLDSLYDGNPKEAILQTVSELKGTFALAIMFSDMPNRIFAIRNVSPVVVACGNGEAYLASDVTAISQYIKRYFVLPEYHLLELSADDMTLYNQNMEVVQPDFLNVDWHIGQNGKDGFEFFMEKEIMEQPQVITDTVLPRLKNGIPDFTHDKISDALFTEYSKVCIIGCGTAMHAGLVAKNLMQSILALPVNVEIASEFMYSDPIVDKDTLVISISQSGETIDTLEALKYAKKHGAGILSIVNVKGSSIARESSAVLFTNAGPEMAVASTKAYTTQLAVLYLIVCRMAYLRGIYDEEQARAFVDELLRVPDMMRRMIARREDIHKIARNIKDADDLFMIGRGLDYATILEGSLKLKEISYIHSEAYTSGELKHGTIALITKDTPVIAMVTQSRLQSKELSNAIEVRARGAEVFLFMKEGFQLEEEKEWNTIFRLPAMQDNFMVFPAIIVLQLLSFFVSADKGLDVDKPRNLAKVVTVE